MHPVYMALHEVTRHMVHGCMVNTECTRMVAVSHGTSHGTTKQHCKYTTSVDIQNMLQKASCSFGIKYDKSAVSLLVSGGERCYIKENGAI